MAAGPGSRPVAQRGISNVPRPGGSSGRMWSRHCAGPALPFRPYARQQEFDVVTEDRSWRLR